MPRISSLKRMKQEKLKENIAKHQKCLSENELLNIRDSLINIHGRSRTCEEN